MLRVYLNKFEDAPLLWSVDEGSKASEKRFSRVVMVGVSMETDMNMAADNVSEPKCWLQMQGLLEIYGTVALIGRNPNDLSMGVRVYNLTARSV